MSSALRVSGWILLAVVATGAVAADDKPLPLADELAKIKRDFFARRREFESAWTQKENKTLEIHDQLAKEFRKDADRILERAIQLAEQHAEDPAAAETLVWVISGTKTGQMDATDHAFRLLTERFINSDKLGPVLPAARAFYETSDGAREFESALARKSPHRDLQALACYGLAVNLARTAGEARFYKTPRDDRQKALWVANTTPAYRKLVDTADPDKLQQEAVSLFEKVIKEFGDVKSSDGSRVTLGEIANGKLLNLLGLVEGKPAPEIIGEDVDGKPMKLSDFRGKVVLLSFWATTCDPCMAMVPMEKKMVEQMKNRPFVLLGVNVDKSRDVARKAIETKGISWRSWWNGADGPITTHWGVSGFPSLFIVDQRGIIRRANDVRDDELPQIIAKIVAEAEQNQR